MIKNDRANLNEALEMMNSDIKNVFVSELKGSIDKALEKAKGEKKARVESAVSLTKEERTKIEETLTRILKRRIEITYSVKPSLLGGFRVAVGDWKLDDSILHHLEQMKHLIGGQKT